MVNTNVYSINKEITKMLKERFDKSSFWERVEPEIITLCSELPEPYDKESTKDFIKKLKKIKDFLIDQDVASDELTFIDDEITMHNKTKMISLYEEKDDSVPMKVIHGYSRLGAGTEGVVAIPQDYNYSQLSKLTNGVYEKTGLVKFYISKEKDIYGKIIAEIYEHSQEIPIATVIESKKMNKELGEPMYKKIVLFGDKMKGNEVNVVKEITLPFYVYRFITEDNNELILMTLTQCEIGDYVITGVQTKCDDNKMLTESAKLPTKLPFFFAQKLRNRIIKFRNHEEFNKRLKELKVNRDTFFDYPFTFKKGDRTYKLLQPNWYKWLIWSWLTHQNKGLINSYPMHLLIVGPKMSGKSLLLNSLHAKSKETRSIFSGSSSTLKHLVPSFKYNPARLGYLAESNRFSFCDEFLRCLINTRTTKDGSQREESVAMMNDLLEHQKREAGSGVSRINVNMTSRIIATTNPIRDIKNLDDLVNTFDESFLSRWMIYYQGEEHVQMVRRSRDSDLETYDYKMSVNDWISITDYLQTFSSEYDLKKVEEIHGSVPKVLSENLNKHYDARHMHHIECIIDGIVKTRCLVDGDMSFKATDEDYKTLKEVWLNLIRSWLRAEQIKDIDIKDRISFLPENCQFIYWKICKLEDHISKEKIKELALKTMSETEFLESFQILIDMGMAKISGGRIRPYYISNIENGVQSNL